MRTRLNPWPATTDLFSSLVAATFGALMLYIPYSLGVQGELEKRLAKEARMTKLQELSTQLRDSVKQALLGTPGARKPRPCGEDLCLDVDISFAPNMSDIDPIYGASLRKVARDVKNALTRVPAELRRCVELTIEGHTDQTVPQTAMSERDKILYNWRLSNERASSVLYLFYEEGVRSPEYRILALGYADSERLEQTCALQDDTCNARNRRTTFRIQIDTINLERESVRTVSQ